MGFVKGNSSLYLCVPVCVCLSARSSHLCVPAVFTAFRRKTGRIRCHEKEKELLNWFLPAVSAEVDLADHLADNRIIQTRFFP